MREKHKKNMNTKGNNTQIVTKTNQIFIQNIICPSLLQIVSFYRVEIVKKPGRKGASGERTSRRLRPFASRLLPRRPTWSSRGGVTRKCFGDPVQFHDSYDNQ